MDNWSTSCWLCHVCSPLGDGAFPAFAIVKLGAQASPTSRADWKCPMGNVSSINHLSKLVGCRQDELVIIATERSRVVLEVL